MSPTSKNQLPEGSQDAILSALILFILDQLDRTTSTPDPHYQYLRAIFRRYPLQVIITEIRNILAALYFPQAADLAHLVMQYHGILLVPQQKADNYYTTFIYKEALHSTSMVTTPLKSLELAQHMVDQLRAGVQLPSSIMEEQTDTMEEQTDLSTLHVEKASTVAASAPVVAAAQTAPSFIRLGRISLSIDKILYIKDDSTEHYPSVRVGLAGGVDMRLDANPVHNYIHTQEVRFIGEEASAFLAWHQRWTLDLPPPALPGRGAS